MPIQPYPQITFQQPQSLPLADGRGLLLIAEIQAQAARVEVRLHYEGRGSAGLSLAPDDLEKREALVSALGHDPRSKLGWWSAKADLFAALTGSPAYKEVLALLAEQAEAFALSV